ncbi:MAG: GC-type dockerin domain-anchored protein [Planctomycetota bacterium]
MRTAPLLCAALAAATTSSQAAIGDKYVRVVYCHVDGGEFVWYGAGSCDQAETVLGMFGHTFKSCQQLVVIGSAGLAGEYETIVSNPQLPASGSVENIGAVGQGVVIAWRPDGLPHAVRMGGQGLQIAPLPLPAVMNGTDLENFQLARGGQSSRWVFGSDLGSVGGDFESVYDTGASGSTPFRQPFNVGQLQFSPAMLPCNVADTTPPFGQLDLPDIDSFISSFAVQNGSVDIAEPFGVIDLADVDAFIGAYLAGCP